ncbi:hypothetical protein ASF10_09315 [Flavobacterium sp. Leaf82]|nr:hypothetical protein ASF10_09315 [Flavobacterium sp. Leaf82]
MFLYLTTNTVFYYVKILTKLNHLYVRFFRKNITLNQKLKRNFNLNEDFRLYEKNIISINVGYERSI